MKCPSLHVCGKSDLRSEDAAHPALDAEAQGASAAFPVLCAASVYNCTIIHTKNNILVQFGFAQVKQRHCRCEVYLVRKRVTKRSRIEVKVSKKYTTRSCHDKLEFFNTFSCVFLVQLLDSSYRAAF